jgi:hypothetical protein
MKFLQTWWNSKFRKREPDRIMAMQAATFTTPQGNDTLMYWMENINLKPPDSVDPYVINHWHAQCKFVSDLINMVEVVNFPEKYRTEQRKPRPIIGGSLGG